MTTQYFTVQALGFEIVCYYNGSVYGVENWNQAVELVDNNWAKALQLAYQINTEFRNQFGYEDSFMQTNNFCWTKI
jgi:hypothetical protein